MLLCEALLLLLLDEEKGSPVHRGWAHDDGLAGTVLLDLLAADVLVARDDDTLVADGSIDGPLGVAADALRSPMSAKKAVSAVKKALKPIKETIAEPLVSAGVLDETRHKRLGLFETTRYPELDAAPETRLRAELSAVLVSGQSPSPFIASLLAVLEPMDLVKGVVDRPDRRAASKRAKEVAERGAVGDAVKSAVQSQIAAIVATSAATAAAASSSSSGS
jgi:hypothetical protein